MLSARQLHTATLLPNGRVLILGGSPSFDSLVAYNSAEVWDPVTGLFSAAPSLIFARERHSATLLNSGQVLVIGGHNTVNVTDIELYRSL